MKISWNRENAGWFYLKLRKEKEAQMSGHISVYPLTGWWSIVGYGENESPVKLAEGNADDVDSLESESLGVAMGLGYVPS